MYHVTGGRHKVAEDKLFKFTTDFVERGEGRQNGKKYHDEGDQR
jgi:hypothetical protein